MSKQVSSETAPEYGAVRKKTVDLSAASDDAIITAALRILERRIRKPVTELGSPISVKQFLTLMLSEHESESFGVIYLNNRHRVIEWEVLFNGTIDMANVYPREVVKACLKHNAAAVILFHNHPSGNPDPSHADELITSRLKDALGLVDIRVLDHMIVGGTDCVSFAERGLI